MRWYCVIPFAMLTGCGTFVPSLTVHDDDQLYTINVHDSIQCEVIDAVKKIYTQIENVRFATNSDPSLTNREKLTKLRSLAKLEKQFAHKWGLFYSVTLSIVEDSSVNPSIDILSPATPVNMLLPGDAVFTLNTGLAFTAKATRKETTQVFYTIGKIMEFNRCGEGAPRNKMIPFGNTLRLSDWTVRQFMLISSDLIISLDSKESMTYEVKFELGKRGNVNPKWTFLQRNLNKASGLFNGGRVSSHSVIFTLGPTTDKRRKLEETALAAHNARLIGDAIER